MDITNLDIASERIEQYPLLSIAGFTFLRDQDSWILQSKFNKIEVNKIPIETVRKMGVMTDNLWVVNCYSRVREDFDWNNLFNYPVCYAFLEAACFKAIQIYSAEKLMRLMHAHCNAKGHLSWSTSVYKLHRKVCVSSGHSVLKGVERLIDIT